MLELTILKGIHSTEKEAKKLRPFIEDCDIFGIEAAYCPLDQAIETERLWEENLKLTRSAFRKWTESCHQSNIRDRADYALKMEDSLYLSQKPIFLIERYKQEDAIKLRGESIEIQKSEARGIDLLSAGRLDEFLSQYHANVLQRFNFAQKRDMHMAENILSIEEKAQEQHGSLFNSKGIIKFTVNIGAMHRPEDYIKTPCVIKSLYDELPLQVSLLPEMYASWKKTGEVTSRDVLAHGLAVLQYEKRINSIIEPSQFRNGSLDELKSYLIV